VCVCLQCVRKATTVAAALSDVTALIMSGRDGQAELCVCVFAVCAEGYYGHGCTEPCNCANNDGEGRPG